MIPALILLAAHYVNFAGALLPDPVATPGATRTASVAVVCRQKTAAVRHVTAAMKRQVYRLYGVKPAPGICCEVDHLIPLELGGSNAIANLWPQPYEPRPGAHEKDVLENALHAAVCSGRLTLKEAQRAISGNWIEAYRKRRD